MTFEQENLYAMRIRAHAAVDALWMKGYVTRQTAYNWLARRMKLTPETCHIALFTLDQCRKAIKEARARLRREETKVARGDNLFPGIDEPEPRKGEDGGLQKWADDNLVSPSEEIF